MTVVYITSFADFKTVVGFPVSGDAMTQLIVFYSRSEVQNLSSSNSGQNGVAHVGL